MNDENLYLKVTEEVTRGNIDEALWTEAISIARGDDEKGKYEYINLRVAQLKKSTSGLNPESVDPVQQTDTRNSFQEQSAEHNTQELYNKSQAESPNTSSFTQSVANSSDNENKKDYNRFGGWLVVVGLGMIVSSIRIVWSTVPMYYEIFTSGSWEVLTTPGTDVYNQFWAPILIIEIVANFGLVFGWIHAIRLFFQKKKTFPTTYIAMVTVSFIVVLGDTLAITALLPEIDHDMSGEVLRGFVAAVIWIPYMRISKRVKATFYK